MNDIKAFESVECFKCGKPFVPSRSADPQGRCPACVSVSDFLGELTAGEQEIPQPPAAETDLLGREMPVQHVAPLSAASRIHSDPQFAYDDLWDAGILGGLAMVALSIVWFGTRLFFGGISIFAPMLFVIGTAAILRGIGKYFRDRRKNLHSHSSDAPHKASPP